MPITVITSTLLSPQLWPLLAAISAFVSLGNAESFTTPPAIAQYVVLVTAVVGAFVQHRRDKRDRRWKAEDRARHKQEAIDRAKHIEQTVKSEIQPVKEVVKETAHKLENGAKPISRDELKAAIREVMAELVPPPK